METNVNAIETTEELVEDVITVTPSGEKNGLIIGGTTVATLAVVGLGVIGFKYGKKVIAKIKTKRAEKKAKANVEDESTEENEG